MPSTMVLRFRDLSVDDTIGAHGHVIDQHGYVWWGWWSRPDERIPRNVFADFNGRILEGPFDIFLLDSGTATLYRARVVAIVVSPTDRPMASPEPGETPGYYSGTACKAWLKLASIDAAPDNALRAYAYDEIPPVDYVDDPAGVAFDGKRVFDLEEVLRRQHRTIYFLRPHRPGDADYPVILLPTTAPSNFITTPIVADSPYILHLSDVHFNEQSHQFARISSGVRPSLARRLIDDLRRHYGDTPPAAIIISGDLTWRGVPEEYAWAHEFVSAVQSAYGLDASHVLAIPGNHDITWGSADPPPTRRGRSGATGPRPVTPAPEKAERAYREFATRLFGVAPELGLAMGRRYLLADYSVVDIVGLHTARLEKPSFAGYGYVSLAELEAAARRMGWDRPKKGREMRLLVLHHHVLPVTPQESLDSEGERYSLTLDAGEILYACLELEVDLIAHGHMHQPFAATYSRSSRANTFPGARSLAVHGAGSVGVRRDHVGQVGKNSFTTYEIKDNRPVVVVWSFDDNASRFAPDWRYALEPNPAGGLRAVADA